MYLLEITQSATVLLPSRSAGVDFVALAGIAGTLLGTALGAFVTWKIQKYQLQHEDRTRFHDRRLTVYAGV